MAKSTERKPSALIEVQCPCCEATLRIDVDTRAVITHQVKEKPAPVEDLSAAVRRIKEEEARRGDKFQKHVEDQRNHQAVLNRKFDELFKKAQEDPDSLQPRPKDIDWD
jgi:hypothetical protein